MPSRAPRHRRPSRRHRVRVRGDPGPMGGPGVRDPPPRADRRIEGKLGSEHRSVGPSSPPARPNVGRGGGDRRASGGSYGRRPGALPRSSRWRAAKRRGDTTGDRRQPSPPASRKWCWPTTRGGATGSTPTIERRGSSPSMPSSPLAIRCSFPTSDPEPHRPDRLLLWEADLPNHVEDADGFDGTKIQALLCHRSQYRSTMDDRGRNRRCGRGIRRSAPSAATSRAGNWPTTDDWPGSHLGEAFHVIDRV